MMNNDMVILISAHSSLAIALSLSTLLAGWMTDVSNKMETHASNWH